MLLIVNKFFGLGKIICFVNKPGPLVLQLSVEYKIDNSYNKNYVTQSANHLFYKVYEYFRFIRGAGKSQMIEYVRRVVHANYI